MGQNCSTASKQITNQIYQNDEDNPPSAISTQSCQDINFCQQANHHQHRIPKASSLNIKTLTDKNMLSDLVIRSINVPKRKTLLTGLQYFKQFITLRDLIEAKQEQNRQILESSDEEKENDNYQLTETLKAQKLAEIGQSLNKYIQKEKIFNNVSINIADFIYISEQPITEYYQFKQKIGEGSFGNVYRAICKQSRQQRAIKVLKKKQMSKQTKKQFLAQMELLSKLDHPNIIKVYQLYYYNSFYYVVTELCKGGNILNYINKSSHYDQKFVCKIIKQLLSALLYLHQNNIVHLDIKLENVVFLEKFQNENEKVYIKLIDFGCSKTFTPYKKKKGKISGTLSYIAPQCLQGYYSQKCDIWSTGVLLHILLSGISPFKGRDSKQTMKNIEKKQIKFESENWDKISFQAKQLISLMLVRNSTKRISAKNALQHNWFNEMKNSKTVIISQQVISNLERYYRGNNLVTIIQTFLSLKKINQQERMRLADIFISLDTDNNGEIQVSELQEVYKKYFGHHEVAEVQHIINKIDLNKSSSINFNEFLVAMSDRKKIFEQQHLKQAFEHFDIDKTGFIERNELREILKGCQKEEFDFILKQLDKDGDLKISRQEFISYLSKF